MKIKLSNGKELEPLMVTGGQQYVQGQSRDTLSFVFGETADMAELDQAFRAENCGDIILTDDQGGEYLHHGYAIRHELKKASVESKPATTESEAEYVMRVTVNTLVLDALGGDDNV